MNRSLQNKWGREEEGERRGGEGRRAKVEASGVEKEDGMRGGKGGELGLEEWRRGGSRIIIIQPLSNVLQR